MSSADDSSELQADPVARARRRGKTLIFGLFVTFATAFIGISTLQITLGVFKTPPSIDDPRIDEPCRAALRGLETKEILARGTLTDPQQDRDTRAIAAAEHVCSGNDTAIDAFLERLRIILVTRESSFRGGRAFSWR